MGSRKIIRIEQVRARDLIVGDVLENERIVLEVWSTGMHFAKVAAEASDFVKLNLRELDERYVLIRLEWTSGYQVNATADGVTHWYGADRRDGLPGRHPVWNVMRANETVPVQMSANTFTAEPHMVDRHLPGDAPSVRIDNRAIYQVDDEDGFVDVQVYRSEHDSAIVVEIDTPEVLGDDPEEFLRVNVNDNFVWGKEYERDIHLD